MAYGTLMTVDQLSNSSPSILGIFIKNNNTVCVRLFDIISRSSSRGHPVIDLRANGTEGAAHTSSNDCTSINNNRESLNRKNVAHTNIDNVLERTNTIAGHFREHIV